MPELTIALNQFDAVLSQIVPTVATRLQPGLSCTEIDQQTAAFAWSLPSDLYDLYQWHNGLSGRAAQLNWAEQLLRLKGKWHGELAGRANEIHVRFADRLLVAKFLPLEYALAGHRHLKLGGCLLDLLPIAVLTDGNTTIYCLMQLAVEPPTLFCANGTKLPPMKITEAFLATQPQFELSDFIVWLTRCVQQAASRPTANLADQTRGAIDCEIDSAQFAQFRQFGRENTGQ
ncbi:hypothetical protein H6F67_26325 [Microcoleus sp. FACHB-1515]|uniref:hypothetical protein n=1 Tax=Cyanophyceae TaxID=3028117 RepID=UPI00168599C0|nr:hypothetical protein [Microcoleus sp. FACHB-1515]MBD2093366.1 hypothetical protein [Microcoleus sp. FACHB-1515]